MVVVSVVWIVRVVWTVVGVTVASITAAGSVVGPILAVTVARIVRIGRSVVVVSVVWIVRVVWTVVRVVVARVATSTRVARWTRGVLRKDRAATYCSYRYGEKDS